MSRNYVSAGRRLSMASPVAHKAGDLVFYHGFFGWLQDDVASGALVALILEGEVTYDNPKFLVSRLLPGTKMYADPTIVPTTLTVYPQASAPTTAYPIGRLTATSATASGKMILFDDNAY